jgi:hypothetical protein
MEIQHHKYSIFSLENILARQGNETLSENKMNYICTWDTLKEAKEDQKEYDFKTIIIPTY